MASAMGDSRLVELEQDLDRLRRRARRLRRGMEQGSSQWAAWSSTTNEAFDIVDRMTRVRADGLTGVAIKINTVVWFLLETDAVLDAKAARQLRLVAREAQRLVAGFRSRD